MEQDELLKFLFKTNSSMLQPVDEKVIKSILDLVVQYPLDDDREICQEEIKKLLMKKELLEKECVSQK